MGKQEECFGGMPVFYVSRVIPTEAFPFMICNLVTFSRMVSFFSPVIKAHLAQTLRICPQG